MKTRFFLNEKRNLGRSIALLKINFFFQLHRIMPFFSRLDRHAVFHHLFGQRSNFRPGDSAHGIAGLSNIGTSWCPGAHHQLHGLVFREQRRMDVFHPQFTLRHWLLLPSYVLLAAHRRILWQQSSTTRVGDEYLTLRLPSG